MSPRHAVLLRSCGINTPIRSIRLVPLTPLFATLTSPLQVVENTGPLSPVFATLTSRVTRKSFACHSYEETPGGWYPSLAFGSAFHLRPSRFAVRPRPDTVLNRQPAAARLALASSFSEFLISRLAPPFSCIIPRRRGSAHIAIIVRGGLSV